MIVSAKREIENWLQSGFAILLLLVLLAFLPVTAVTAADESAGSLRNKSGDVLIERNGNTQKAEEGTPVFPGDIIRTGGDGSVGIIFKDNSRISLGPDSILNIKQFIFEPSKSRYSFVGRLLKGIASFISGKMTKLSPESVIFETPTSTIGVRGTSYHIKVSGE
ncbi:MAG TPA: FecR domain-containing protein [Dissulfurispiraceae bacterium]|nr:FecR domain-containing protein [Dissulfurispiraceae bacterium]